MSKKRPLENALDSIETEIEELSIEWDRLDSQGISTGQQRDIVDTIAKLESARGFIKDVLATRKNRDKK